VCLNICFLVGGEDNVGACGEEEFGWNSKNVKKGWGNYDLKRKHFSFKKKLVPHDSLLGCYV